MKKIFELNLSIFLLSCNNLQSEVISLLHCQRCVHVGLKDDDILFKCRFPGKGQLKIYFSSREAGRKHGRREGE